MEPMAKMHISVVPEKSGKGNQEVELRTRATGRNLVPENNAARALIDDRKQ